MRTCRLSLANSYNLPKRASSTPDSLPQARKLNYLRVINEEVGGCTLVLNVIRENFRIGSFEPFHPKDQRYIKTFMNSNGSVNERKITYMIFSLGNAEVTAEMTSVRQFRTFSVIPSLSIMIIY